MFVHMSVYFVKPESEHLLADSMKRFGNAMKSFPGFRNDDLDAWEVQSPESFHLQKVHSVNPDE